MERGAQSQTVSKRNRRSKIREYDPSVPSMLKANQEWFASVITRPLIHGMHILPISSSSCPIEEEAPLYIAPSRSLKSHQRIEIYNQQYWWRLLNILQESFPLLTRLFGVADFNQTIAVPYLTNNPPHHWSLSVLGDTLPQWLSKEYQREDRALVLAAAQVDWAFTSHFLVEGYKPLQTPKAPDDVADLSTMKLYLQPYVSVFCFPFDIFSFRELFIKEEENYWIDHDFPSLMKEKNYMHILFRASNLQVSWKEISPNEYYLLNLFKKGCSVEEACAALEENDPSLNEEVFKDVAVWFQEWVIRQWLCPRKRKWR